MSGSRKESVTIQVSEFGGRASFYDLEHPDKGRERREATTQSYVSDRAFRFDQQLRSFCDPFLVYIFIEGNVCELPEQP